MVFHMTEPKECLQPASSRKMKKKTNKVPNQSIDPHPTESSTSRSRLLKVSSSLRDTIKQSLILKSVSRVFRAELMQ